MAICPRKELRCAPQLRNAEQLEHNGRECLVDFVFIEVYAEEKNFVYNSMNATLRAIKQLKSVSD